MIDLNVLKWLATAQDDEEGATEVPRLLARMKYAKNVWASLDGGNLGTTELARTLNTMLDALGTKEDDESYKDSDFH